MGDRKVTWIRSEGGATFGVPHPIPLGIADRIEAGKIQVIDDPNVELVGEETPADEPVEPVEPAPERPHRGARKADLVAWVTDPRVALATKAEAEALNRDELYEKFVAPPEA